jgi:toxin ParE1/3/4
MTGRYILSPRAQIDLDEIWNYTAKRWSIDQAELYIRRLWQHIEAAQTTIGGACPNVREGYYKYQSGSHLLFYRLMGGIDVIRILQSAWILDGIFKYPTMPISRTEAVLTSSFREWGNFTLTQFIW